MSDEDAYSLICDDLTRIKEDELGHSPFSQGCIDGALDYIRDLRADLFAALSGDSTPVAGRKIEIPQAEPRRWWVIHEDDLATMLRRVEAGESPDLLVME